MKLCALVFIASGHPQTRPLIDFVSLCVLCHPAWCYSGLGINLINVIHSAVRKVTGGFKPDFHLHQDEEVSFIYLADKMIFRIQWVSYRNRVRWKISIVMQFYIYTWLENVKLYYYSNWVKDITSCDSCRAPTLTHVPLFFSKKRNRWDQQQWLLTCVYTVSHCCLS